MNFKENILFLIISIVAGVLGVIVFSNTTDSLLIGVLIGVLFFVSSYIYLIKKGKKKKR